jgi:hypothetical protein
VGSGQSFAGISLSSVKSKQLAGPAPSLALDSIAGFTLTGEWATERRPALEVRYELLPGLVGGAILDAFDAGDLVAGVDTTTSVVHTVGEFGTALNDTAALIKANIGVKVVAGDGPGRLHARRFGAC